MWLLGVPVFKASDACAEKRQLLLKIRSRANKGSCEVASSASVSTKASELPMFSLTDASRIK